MTGAVEILIFEDTEGEVEFGVMILQQFDEGLDGRGVEIERGSHFGGLD